jgi:Nodulation protein Z (NodZ)
MDRYVVARHAFGGIGDHLSCLIGAWWLAKRTGRTLVIDWRGSRFSGDPSGRHNCFADYFTCADRLGEVDVIADDRVAGIEWPTPIYPAKWTADILATPVHMKHTADEITAMNQLVNGGADRPEPTLAINQWVSPHPPKETVKELLEELQATAPIKAEAQKFWDEKLGSADVVGIHIRHGNGENIGARAAYWLGPIALARQLHLNNRNDVHRPGLSGRFLDNMPESLVGTDGQRRFERRFYRRIGAEFRDLSRSSKLTKALLFTDAPQVFGGLREFIPSLVACPKHLMTEGAGPLHQLSANSIEQSEAGGIRSSGIDQQITREMFVELELLRRCDALVCMDSGFSIFAQRRLADAQIRFLKPDRLNILVMKVMSRLAR